MMAAGARDLRRGSAPRAVKVFFDGGCRPNPGPVETAVVMGGAIRLRHDHGHGDNNDAEWLACLDALRVAREAGLTDVILIGDSTLVVHQASGVLGTAPSRFQPYLDRYRAEAAGFARLRIRYIRRAQNLAGIALERAGGRI
jgi:ribonuclease HI